MIPKLTGEQRAAFDTIVAATQTRSADRCFIVEGSGGTGKTHLYKALYFYLTSKGFKVSTTTL